MNENEEEEALSRDLRTLVPLACVAMPTLPPKRGPDTPESCCFQSSPLSHLARPLLSVEGTHLAPTLQSGEPGTVGR